MLKNMYGFIIRIGYRLSPFYFDIRNYNIKHYSQTLFK